MIPARLNKTTFASGELSDDLLGRTDLQAYSNGARKLRNVEILPTGGVRRRPGLRHVAEVSGGGRLIEFEFNRDQTYVLLFSASRIDIYKNGAFLTYVTTPYSEQDIKEIGYTQNADTLFVVHGDHPPKMIYRTSDESNWVIQDFEFSKGAGSTLQSPFYNFGEPGLLMACNGFSGTVEITTNGAYFTADHVGKSFMIDTVEVVATSLMDVDRMQATVTKNHIPPEATESRTIVEMTEDWGEEAFSAERGYPVSVSFHQGRLVFGGSRSIPNRIWMSRIAQITNFDLGEALADDAIEFSLLSDQVNAIRSLYSGRHLQIFTTGGEWALMGQPLTPTNAEVTRHTQVGSPVTEHVPPINVDGATLFVARNEAGLREFVYSDLEAAYQARDLTVMSKHMFNAPVSMAYNPVKRLLYVVMADGTMGALTIYHAEKVTAWSLFETNGEFLSVATAGDKTYVLVKRNGKYLVEEFDSTLHTDGGLTAQSGTPYSTWSNLDHLEGLKVSAVADGRVQTGLTVSGGSVTLSEAVEDVEIGLPFTHIIEPLTPMIQTQQGTSQGQPLRLVKVRFRLLSTQALAVDTGMGVKYVPFRNFGTGQVDTIPPKYTGDKVVRGRGWTRDLDKSLWRIEQDLPLPFTLLSAIMELRVGD